MVGKLRGLIFFGVTKTASLLSRQVVRSYHLRPDKRGSLACLRVRVRALRAVIGARACIRVAGIISASRCDEDQGQYK